MLPRCRPPAPKKAWWSVGDRSEPSTPGEPVDWATVPAVDPWAGEDTPIDPFPAVPDLPETQLPPTRVESPPPAPPAASAPPPQSKTGRAVPPPPSRPALPPQPPALSRKERKAMDRRAAEQRAAGRQAMNRQPVQARPALPEPPPWVPREVRRPLPPQPRKRRRWGRRLALFSLAGLLCCCGGPVAWFQFPAARQYPVSAEPAEVLRRPDPARRPRQHPDGRPPRGGAARVECPDRRGLRRRLHATGAANGSPSSA